MKNFYFLFFFGFIAQTTCCFSGNILAQGSIDIEMRTIQKNLKTALTKHEQQKFEQDLKKVSAWAFSAAKMAQFGIGNYEEALRSIRTFAIFNYYYDVIVKNDSFSQQAIIGQATKLINDEVKKSPEWTPQKIQAIISHLHDRLFREIDYTYFHETLNIRESKKKNTNEKYLFRWPVIEGAENIIPGFKSKLSAYIGKKDQISLEEFKKKVIEFIKENYNPEMFDVFFKKPWELLVDFVNKSEVSKNSKWQQHKTGNISLINALAASMACYVRAVDAFQEAFVQHTTIPDQVQKESIGNIVDAKNTNEHYEQFIESRCQTIAKQRNSNDCEQSLNQTGNQKKMKKFCKNLFDDFFNYLISQHKTLSLSEKQRVKEVLNNDFPNIVKTAQLFQSCLGSADEGHSNKKENKLLDPNITISKKRKEKAQDALTKLHQKIGKEKSNQPDATPVRPSSANSLTPETVANRINDAIKHDLLTLNVRTMDLAEFMIGNISLSQLESNSQTKKKFKPHKIGAYSYKVNPDDLVKAHKRIASNY